MVRVGLALNPVLNGLTALLYTSQDANVPQPGETSLSNNVLYDNADDLGGFDGGGGHTSNGIYLQVGGENVVLQQFIVRE